MQIRRPQPDAVQRQINVAKSLSKMTEPPWITGIERILHRSQFFRVRIKPVTVGSDLVDRHYVADVLPVEIAAVAAVAICAVLRVKFFALRCELLVNRK